MKVCHRLWLGCQAVTRRPHALVTSPWWSVVGFVERVFHGISSISVSGVVGIDVGEPTGFVFLYLGQLLSWFVGGGKGLSLHPGGAIPFGLLLSVKGAGWLRGYVGRWGLS